MIISYTDDGKREGRRRGTGLGLGEGAGGENEIVGVWVYFTTLAPPG